MDYTNILRRAWQITWKHKALWLFGFLLSLFSGGGGTGSSQGVQRTFGAGDRLTMPSIFVIVVLALFFVLFFVVLGIVVRYLSLGALIGMVREAEKTGETSVGSGWRMGWSRFLPLFGIDLVVGIPAAIVSMVLIGIGLSPLLLLLAEQEAVAIGAIGLTVFLMLLVIGFLIVMGLVLSVLGELARRQCVMEETGVFDSIRAGYRIGRENLRHVAIIWVMLFGVSLAYGITMAALAIIGIGVAVVPAAALLAITETVGASLLVGLLLAIPGILILSVLGGVYEVFRSAVWTLFYSELETQPS
jgi:hypothetical protein